MNILISTALWGKDYLKIFLNYNIPSLLYKKVEKLKFTKIVFLILTQKKFNSDLHAFLLNKKYSKKIEFKIINFEKFKLFEHDIPHKYDIKKYKFLNACQKFFFQYSIDHNFDYHIINYPDFIWSIESLTELINHNFYTNKFFAFNCFCLPVSKSFLRKLNKKNSTEFLSIDSFNYNALENLHTEVLTRDWNLKDLSSYPSFLYWKINDEGILLRTFHQHLIALDVKEFKKVFDSKIDFMSLDSDFTFYVKKNLKTKTFFIPDKFNLVSLHDTKASSLPLFFRKKDTIFRNFVKNHCTIENIKSFENCFYFKNKKKFTPKHWDYLKKQSFNQTKAYLKSYKIKPKQNNFSNQQNLNYFQSEINLKCLKIFKKQFSYYKFSIKIFIKNFYLKSMGRIK